MKMIKNTFEVISMTDENGRKQPRLYVVVEDGVRRPATRIERLEFWAAFDAHKAETAKAANAYEAEKAARLAAEKAAAEKKAAKIAKAAEKKAAGRAIQANTELYAAVKALEKADLAAEEAAWTETIETADVLQDELADIRRDIKAHLKAAQKAERATVGTDAHSEAADALKFHSAQLSAVDAVIKATKMAGVTVLNDGNPVDVFDATEGYLFTISPSTAKKQTGYRTDKPVLLTEAEKRMPGVVVCQNRGMLFSSCRPISGKYIIPELGDLNLIVVDEKSRKLKPVDDDENRIAWKGNGDHEIKDVAADGAGFHYFNKEDGSMAFDLWFKIAKFMYGCKGMIMPGLATDVGKTVVDHWNIERKITSGNTMLINSSLIKGLNAYSSREELIAHGEEWGLTTMMKQWQSGDHKVAKERIIGTQVQATNLAQTREEVSEMLKPGALKIWAMKYPEIAWKKLANINTARGRAFAARPSLVYKDLIMRQIDQKAGNDFLRNAQGKVMAEGSYLKMFPDRLAYSLCYVDGLSINEAAKKAAQCGLHGEIRVSPEFAGRKIRRDEDGNEIVTYAKETFVDAKGRWIEVALVRYPHGAPSETIIVKAYLDETVPADVIMFPFPVANDDGTIPVRVLYAFRLQGADFDGDAVTAISDKRWLASQKRNTGKSYMIIPVNTEGTEKDKTLVTDESFETFCQQKIQSLSNRVGLIATSLKYYMSQAADAIRAGANPEIVAKMIVDHACAMGDDIDEFKHGKAESELEVFVVNHGNGDVEYLWSPYFNRYACKYRTEEDFKKAIFTKSGAEKRPGNGSLDMYASEMEKLMKKCGLEIVPEVSEASDGTPRWYFTVHPVQWQAQQVELFLADHGVGQVSAVLPAELEMAYGVEPGTRFTAKELFNTLYRDHAASCKSLMGTAEKDEVLKKLNRIDERYALAKVAVIAWTKEMWSMKAGEKLTAEEALVMFTTLMTQHSGKARSVIETETRFGTFQRQDGTEYQISAFSALRKFNYFLDLCGDGLLFTKVEEPKFPAVSEKVLAAAGATAPDIDKAMEMARKELALIEQLVDMLPLGMDVVISKIDEDYVPARDPADVEVFEDGSMILCSEEDENEPPIWA